MQDSKVLFIFDPVKPENLTNMNTSTIAVIVVVVACVLIVASNRYHHRRHHYNVDKLDETVRGILTLQPDKVMKQKDFLVALQHRYNCPAKEALWLLGYAKEHNIIKADDKWVELGGK